MPDAQRWRVSQLLVMPSYQRAGHGSELLRAVYADAASSERRVRDVTVEEPSPAFTAMRDRVDLALLLDAGLLPLTDADEPVTRTRAYPAGEPRSLVDPAAVKRVCTAARERYRLCDEQVRRLVRAARYLSQRDVNRAPAAGDGDAPAQSTQDPKTLSLRERWCALRHWRLYGAPLARLRAMRAHDAVRVCEQEAADSVSAVVSMWDNEAKAFEALRGTFDKHAKAKEQSK